ncbi:hypothetical protein [Bosea caraganae]|nr:hypothetical protein [Bosea caraganae]
MKRLIRTIGILGIVSLLAGCDKCGDWAKFDLFDQAPKSCTSSDPQG